MKKIAIIAATEFEIATLQTMNFKHHQLEIHYWITGIGMLSTAFTLTKKLLENPVDIVFQIGIAGCFNNHISLGEVVAIEKEFLGDVGVEEDGIWKDIFDMGLIPENEHPFTQKCLVNINTPSLNTILLPIATAISVNEITTHPQRIAALKTAYSPIIESMEGAALHYVCNSLQTPYLQVRGISNYVGERDKSRWEMKKAIEASQQAVIKIIQGL